MPLTNDELDSLETMAYVSDAEPFSFFAEHIGYLADLSDAELYAFAGMLFAHGCREQADVVVGYIRSAGASWGLPPASTPYDAAARQDPKEFLAEYLADREAESIPF